jgi:hypothetical protein
MVKGTVQQQKKKKQKEKCAAVWCVCLVVLLPDETPSNSVGGDTLRSKLVQIQNEQAGLQRL